MTDHAGPAGPGADARPALDLVAVAALVEMTGDRAFAQSLMDEFVVDTGALLDRVSAAIRALPDGRAQLQDEAHRLKSSSAIVGAATMCRCAQRLEAAAASTSGGDDALRDLADELAASAPAVFDAIEQRRRGDLG
jgi:HPt (histidine-containing phosphotransfer) domain-containing protein